MNQKLKELIIAKTGKEYQQEMLQSIEEMVCEGSALPLDEDTLYQTIAKEGEFLLINANYDEVSFEDKAFAMKFVEALDIIVSFEDDGTRYEMIESFVKEIHNRTSSLQKFHFGVKKVERLSAYPLKILFGNIYPINQLEIHLGSWIHEFIQLNENYFQPHFKQIRAALSKEIGIPILPLYTQEDKALLDNEVKLIDSVTKEVLVEFSVTKDEDKKALDLYLLKLYYLFLKLGLKYKH
jgi:hypothetical protein